jgi:hypothetical protein
MSPSNLVNPVSFLRITGGGLIALAIGGFALSAFDLSPDHQYFSFTAGVNVAHIFAGLFAITTAMLLGTRPKSLKWLVVLIAIAALFVGIYGLLGDWADKGGVTGPSFLNTWTMSSLADPFDSVFHVLYAVWALVSAFRSPAAASAPAVRAAEGA